MSGPPHAFHDALAEAATAREALEDAALAGTYERPRPRVSREVERAAPVPLPHGPPCPGFARHAGIGMICLHCGLSPAEHAPLPEPVAERLPTPEDVDLGALGFLAEMLHNRAGGPTVLVAIAEIRARRARDAAILARLDAAIRLESWVLVHALRAELRGQP